MPLSTVPLINLYGYRAYIHKRLVECNNFIYGCELENIHILVAIATLKRHIFHLIMMYNLRLTKVK